MTGTPAAHIPGGIMGRSRKWHERPVPGIWLEPDIILGLAAWTVLTAGGFVLLATGRFLTAAIALILAVITGELLVARCRRGRDS